MRASEHPIGAFLVALTGGVGSGKSTVGRMLAERGAIVIDADAIAREVVEPGTPGLDAVVARFGASIVAADGSLDRAGLAAIVFADPAALADLNAITHPLVRGRSQLLLAQVPDGAVGVYEVPLLAEGGPYRGQDFALVIVVEAALPVRLARLADRGLAPDQARARIAAQASDEQRRAIADLVIGNDGTLEQLSANVDQLWQQLLLASSSPERGRTG
jgi:dephospho-CoA kinase